MGSVWIWIWLAGTASCFSVPPFHHLTTSQIYYIDKRILSPDSRRKKDLENAMFHFIVFQRSAHFITSYKYLKGEHYVKGYEAICATLLEQFKISENTRKSLLLQEHTKEYN